MRMMIAAVAVIPEEDEVSPQEAAESVDAAGSA
jgi:hypothetical protein